MQDGFPHADMGDVSAYQQGLERSDPKDWHVIAAARAAMVRHPDGTIAILTRNLKDFHRAELRRLGLYLFDPDQLMSRWWLRDVQGVKAHLLALRDHIGIDHRQPEALEALLKRERLFRLNRLFHGYA